MPLSDLDRRALAIKNQPIEEKLRKAMRVFLVCAISRPGSGQKHSQSGYGSTAGPSNISMGEGGSQTTQEET